MATNLCRGDLDANGFTGTDAAIYADACHRVSPFRVSLTEAISEYEAARSKLPPGIRLSDAVSAYLLRYPEGSIQKTVSEVLAEFTRDRESAHCLAVHLSDIRSRLGQFAAAFQVPVQTLTATLVRDWLRSLRKANKAPLTLEHCQRVKAARLCVRWPEELSLPWAETARRAAAKHLTGGRWSARLKSGTRLSLS